MRDSLHMLDHAMLEELDIKTMGDMIAILKQTKGPPESPPSLASHVKTPRIKLPHLPPTQINIQVYSCTDETIQNTIINTYPGFFKSNPSKLLDMLEALVTQKLNLTATVSIVLFLQGITSTICVVCISHSFGGYYLLHIFLKPFSLIKLWMLKVHNLGRV